MLPESGAGFPVAQGNGARGQMLSVPLL